MAKKYYTITNTAAGARYVHGIDGPVLIRAGETSASVEISDAEVADAKKQKHFEIKSANAPDPEADGEGDGDIDVNSGGELPDDLADSNSRDGMVNMVDLKAKAEAEGVTLESDANKKAIVAAIVAHRAAAAT